MSPPTVVVGPPRPLLDRLRCGVVPRIAVVTASYGAGHNCAAREIEQAFHDAGCDVDVHDLVSLLPWRLGRMLRVAYYTQLRRRPESWGTILRMIESHQQLHRLLSYLFRVIAGPVARATLGCDLVITTHPFGAQALGHARSTGQLVAPAVTYLTDASVHSLWIHPGIDLNVAIHQIAAEDAARHGSTALVVSPLVPASPSPSAGGDPLAAYGVSGPRALVTGGSEGLGDLERTARDILSTGLMTPVVLCGLDTRLQRRLARIPGVVALRWRADMGALIAHSDVVVQNAGGFTSLEALASGTPVISYRPIPGHGVSNSANLEAAGLVPWARTLESLADLLELATSVQRADRLPAIGLDLVTALMGTRETAAA